jgi:predicted transcriptional regulator of viral defense system
MIKSLSKQEYDLLSTFAIKNRKVITVDDVKGSFNFTDGKIRVMLHRLERKGWLERIEKGKYLIVPLEGREGWAEHPFIPISKLVTNYYVSYRTALAYYGFTEQMPFYVFDATIERKSPWNFKDTYTNLLGLVKENSLGLRK